MTITYPIIETQLRLIRALQKGYIEALEAGDWQAADYRCSHLHKLCEGLHHLSQLLNKEGTIPDTLTQRNSNTWVSSIRAVTPTHSPTPAPSLKPADNLVASPPPPSAPTPDPTRYEWGVSSQNVDPPPLEEVWK